MSLKIIFSLIIVIALYSCSVSDQRPIAEPEDTLPVLVNKELTLYYDPGSTELSDRSEIILDSVVSFMIPNPELSVHLVGHAWDEGMQDEMMDLSFDRTLEVRDYLTEKGISSRRITTSGKGSLVPVYTDNEEMEEYNRRVIVIVNDFK